MDDINAWARGITKEIYLTWKEKYSFWKHGVKVFYSPVRVNPSLMIISYQPGGSEKNFLEESKDTFERSDFNPPVINQYLDKYLISTAVRKYFDQLQDGKELLEKSVVFPLIFFRAKNINLWRKDVSELTRIDMENYSFSKVKEIFERLRPEKVLVLGIGTFDFIKERNILGTLKNEEVIYGENGKKRIGITCENGNQKMLTVIHPTGGRASSLDRQRLRTIFAQWLNKNS